jgi:transcriptional regulator with XRE-family HTH domain
VPFGRAASGIRHSIGLTQAQVGQRVGRSQSWVSRAEHGTLVTLTVADADELCRALGATLVFGVEAPILIAGGRQRDAAHARCVAYVAKRLERDGWHVAREVEIGDIRRPGWIDLLAYHPSTRTLLVIEVKTQIVDVGGLERQLTWYQHHAEAAARRRGWTVHRTLTAALFLATEANDMRLRENAGSFRQRFRFRWRELAAVVGGSEPRHGQGWAMAMIDPRSKARTWCRATVLDGRRSTAPYRHPADFLTRANSTWGLRG